MKLNFPETPHPNFVPFEGIAAFIERTTDKPAHIVDYADKGRYIGEIPLLFTRAAVEAALPSLLGMALCFQEIEFLYHVPRSKCGVITEAWIDEDVVRIRGGIYGSDFPDVVAELKKNHSQLALCPLTRDVAIDLKTLPAHGAVLKMSFVGVALMRKGTTAFADTSIRLKH